MGIVELLTERSRRSGGLRIGPPSRANSLGVSLHRRRSRQCRQFGCRKRPNRPLPASASSGLDDHRPQCANPTCSNGSSFAFGRQCVCKSDAGAAPRSFAYGRSFPTVRVPFAGGQVGSPPGSGAAFQFGTRLHSEIATQATSPRHGFLLGWWRSREQFGFSQLSGHSWEDDLQAGPEEMTNLYPGDGCFLRSQSDQPTSPGSRRPFVVSNGIAAEPRETQPPHADPRGSDWIDDSERSSRDEISIFIVSERLILLG